MKQGVKPFVTAIILSLILIALGTTLWQRGRIEGEYRDVGLLVDWSDVQVLSALTGTSVEELLTGFQVRGANGLVVSWRP